MFLPSALLPPAAYLTSLQTREGWWREGWIFFSFFFFAPYPKPCRGGCIRKGIWCKNSSRRRQEKLKVICSLFFDTTTKQKQNYSSGSEKPLFFKLQLERNNLDPENKKIIIIIEYKEITAGHAVSKNRNNRKQIVPVASTWVIIFWANSIWRLCDEMICTMIWRFAGNPDSVFGHEQQ